MITQQQSLSIIGRERTTRSGREVIRSVGDVAELEQFIELAKASGHTSFSADMGKKRDFKPKEDGTPRSGYITRFRSWAPSANGVEQVA